VTIGTVGAASIPLNVDFDDCNYWGLEGGQRFFEARPVHRVAVDGFWIDRAPVTNERFALFVSGRQPGGDSACGATA
jgi:formylglycine-generating enzyme required for sulfatase activity